MTISIDLETFCEINLMASGAYKYVNDPSFEILIFCYCVHGDREEIQTIDLATGGEIAKQKALKVFLSATNIIAHNANFEKMCLEKIFGVNTNTTYECTLVKTAYCGLPLALGQVAKALGFGDEGKDMGGNALIRTFSVPIEPTTRNGGATRYYPVDYPEKWNAFLAYCEQDVRVEMAIHKILAPIKVPQSELAIWELDRKINEKGVLIDVKFIFSVVALDQYVRGLLIDRVKELTGITNPNSAKQLIDWINDTTDENEIEVSTMKKDDVKALILKFGGSADKDIEEVLKIRQQLSKTSTKKYIAMIKTASKDRRIRGLFQYYGANRTGRWAGRLVQLQNLPRGTWSEDEVDEKVAYYKQAIKELDPESFVLEYGMKDIQDILSSLIRSAIIAPKGKSLVVSDLSAIEARVLAWLSGESWREELFAKGGDIYKESASRMFNIPIADIGKEIRAKGKVSELALGYQGGAGALLKMGALEMGLKLGELDVIKDLWRKSNPNIVNFWKGLDAAVRMCFNTDRVLIFRHLKMRIVNIAPKLSFLQIKLPSGRSLFYTNPFIYKNKIGYYGLDDKKKWSKIDTYGGKLTENITQAVARDILVEGLKKADSIQLDIVLHVHDEIGIEGNEEDLAVLNGVLSEPIIWAEGLVLKAEGFVSAFYKK